MPCKPVGIQRINESAIELDDGQWTGIDLAKWPVLKDYVTRIAAGPQVREALKVEGLLKVAKAA